MLSLLLFLSINILTVWAAWQLGDLVFAKAQLTAPEIKARRWPVLIFLSMFLIHSFVLIAGIGGFLNRWGILAELAALLSLLGFLRLRQRNAESTTAAHPVFPRPRVLTPERCLGYGMLAGLIVCWLYAHAWLPVLYLNLDDQIYYASVPIQWLQEGQFHIPEPWTVKSTYPLSSSLLALWFMLPWPPTELGQALAWTGISHLLVVAWGCHSLWELLRRLKVRSVYRLPAAVLFLASYRSYVLCYNFSAPDFSCACFELGAIAYAVRDRTASRPARWLDLLVAALSLGLALGIRPMAFIPAVAIVSGSLLTAYLSGSRLRQLAMEAGVWIVGFFLTGSYWYWRNLLDYGNPVYPGTVGPLPGLTTFPESRISEYAALHGWPAALGGWLVNFSKIYDLHAVLLLMGLVLVGGYCIRTVLRKPGRRVERPILVILGVLVCLFVAFPFQPFSAGYMLTSQASMSQDVQRYLLLGPMLGLVLMFWGVNKLHLSSINRTMFLVVLYGLAIYFFSSILMIRILLITMGLGALVFGLLWKSFSLDRWWNLFRSSLTQRRFLGGGLILGMCLLVVVRNPKKAERSPQNRTFAIESALNEQPAGMGVASFNIFGFTPILSMWGDRMQLKPRIVDRHGARSAKPQMELDLYGVPQTPEAEISPAEFLENLRKSEVNYVVIGTYEAVNQVPFPPQSAWLRDSKQAELLATEPSRQLWKILPKAE